jgi:hypothetical protein
MKNLRKFGAIGLVMALYMVTAISAQAMPQLDIQSPSQVNEGQVFLVRVVAVIQGNGSGNQSIPIAGVMVRPSWTNQTFYTNGNGTVLLTAPQVSYTTNFTIFASKIGFLSDWALIYVINIPSHGGKEYCMQYNDGGGY